MSSSYAGSAPSAFAGHVRGLNKTSLSFRGHVIEINRVPRRLQSLPAHARRSSKNAAKMVNYASIRDYRSEI